MTCKITTTAGIYVVENCVILDAVAEWVKIEKSNKNVKSIEITKLDDIF